MKTIKRTISTLTAIIPILISIILGIAVNFITVSPGERYTPVIYGAIIIFAVTGLALIILLLVRNWLIQRRAVSISLKVGDKEIVAQNLTTKDAARLAELFLSLQEGHFSFANEKISPESTNIEAVEEQHLRNLLRSKPFEINSDETTPSFEQELQHLLALGFIHHKESTGVRELKNQMETHGKADVKEHFYITDEGKKYLESLEPSRTEGQTS